MAHRLVLAFCLVAVASLAIDLGTISSSDQNGDMPTATPSSLPTSVPTQTPTPHATSTFVLSPAPTLTQTSVPTARPTARLSCIPMLMYHYVSVPPPDADIYRLDLSVTPQAFEEQVAYLASNGYQTMRVADAVSHLSKGTPIPHNLRML